MKTEFHSLFALCVIFSYPYGRFSNARRRLKLCQSKATKRMLKIVDSLRDVGVLIAETYYEDEVTESWAFGQPQRPLNLTADIEHIDSVISKLKKIFADPEGAACVENGGSDPFLKAAIALGKEIASEFYGKLSFRLVADNGAEKEYTLEADKIRIRRAAAMLKMPLNTEPESITVVIKYVDIDAGLICTDQEPFWSTDFSVLREAQECVGKSRTIVVDRTAPALRLSSGSVSKLL